LAETNENNKQRKVEESVEKEPMKKKLKPNFEYPELSS
jgi:hypothetical protein